MSVLRMETSTCKMEQTEIIYKQYQLCGTVSTDSRKIERGVIFFALHGASFDGNDFALRALADGASMAVIDSRVVYENAPEEMRCKMVLVEDTLLALQDLAREHRRRLGIPVLGIVGSNGKTTTKELVSRVLSEKFRLQATHGNLNNHIGVPLTLLALKSDTEFAVVEMGASAQKEIELLCSISSPDYGIITNIGRAHMGGFGGVEGIRKGKGELFDSLAQKHGMAFVPREDQTLVDMASERSGLECEFYSREIALGFESHLSGDYNKANIAAAVAVGRYFGVPEESIAHAILSYVPDNNRSQEVQTERNLLIIDCYNANPSSMSVSLDNMADHPQRDKLLILGDMLELGEWSESEHAAIIEKASSIEGAQLILVGNEFRKAYAKICTSVTAPVRLFASWVDLDKFLLEEVPSGYAVLLKGSHSMSLEKVVPRL